jgi:hypothetical protein
VPTLEGDVLQVLRVAALENAIPQVIGLIWRVLGWAARSRQLALPTCWVSPASLLTVCWRMAGWHSGGYRGASTAASSSKMCLRSLRSVIGVGCGRNPFGDARPGRQGVRGRDRFLVTGRTSALTGLGAACAFARARPRSSPLDQPPQIVRLSPDPHWAAPVTC